jgi:hypothetical protein
MTIEPENIVKLPDVKLRLEFTKNVDRLGTHHFKQVQRAGNVVIYQRSKPDGRLFGFEVFVANSESFPLAGGGRTAVTETYPGPNRFGRTAWFCMTIERAQSRFNALVEKEAL